MHESGAHANNHHEARQVPKTNECAVSVPPNVSHKHISSNSLMLNIDEILVHE